MDPGTRLGRYEMIGPIGQGGMGTVYRARDLRLGRLVAVKILRQDRAGPDWLPRFEREARLLATVNHPAIAIVHDVGEAGAVRYLVMELVPGQTLTQRLRQGAVPVEEALEIGRQIAEALAAAHDKGIIHRDLKPGNVMLTPEGKVKVLDFGLARSLEPGTRASSHLESTCDHVQQSEPGLIQGTPAYMAPEQARGAAVDRRCDVWAFGCVLYELLTGEPAFAGPTVSDVVAGILEREPRWEALPPTLPPRIRELIRQCLQKDAHDRWPAGTYRSPD